jgi:hypothetical protein
MSVENGRVICVGEDRDHLISGASIGARGVTPSGVRVGRAPNRELRRRQRPESAR